MSVDDSKSSTSTSVLPCTVCSCCSNRMVYRYMIRVKTERGEMYSKHIRHCVSPWHGILYRHLRVIMFRTAKSCPGQERLR